MGQVLPKGDMEGTSQVEAMMRMREAMERGAGPQGSECQDGAGAAGREDFEGCAKVWTESLGARNC